MEAPQSGAFSQLALILQHLKQESAEIECEIWTLANLLDRRTSAMFAGNPRAAKWNRNSGRPVARQQIESRGELMIEVNGISNTKGVGYDLWRASLEESANQQKDANAVPKATSAKEQKFEGTQDRQSALGRSYAEEHVQSIVSRLRMVALRMSDRALTKEQRTLLEAELKDLHREVQIASSKFRDSGTPQDPNIKRFLKAAKGLGSMLENSIKKAHHDGSAATTEEENDAKKPTAESRAGTLPKEYCSSEESGKSVDVVS